MGNRKSKPKNPIIHNVELECGSNKDDPSEIVKTRIKAASDAILETINKKYESVSSDVNKLPENKRNDSLIAAAYEYQEFGEGSEVAMETQFRSLLVKSGLDLTAMCKSHVDRLVKDMVDKTNNLTAENRSAQYIIDKLTNELSVHKTTLLDITEKKKKSDEILSDANSYVDYMLQNIKDSQDADMEMLLLNHNKTMDSIKNLYSSDIINKTLYEQYLKEYRDKLLELSTSLLTYYDELINSINVGYQREKNATGVDYYNEMYVMVKNENDTFDSMKELVKDMYSGDSKKVEYELQYLDQSGMAMLVLWYTYYIMAIIGIFFMSKNVSITVYTKILVVVVIFFYPQILLYLELYAYNGLSHIHNRTTENIL